MTKIFFWHNLPQTQLEITPLIQIIKILSSEFEITVFELAASNIRQVEVTSTVITMM